MKTDYGKLNRFDVFAVILVAIGIAIIGTELFLGLPHAHRKSLTDAVRMFDIHEQFESHVAFYGSVLDGMDRVYQETYVAFGETWSFPEATSDWSSRVGRAMSALGSLSDQLAGNYERTRAGFYAQAPQQGGQVLGTSIELATGETLAAPDTPVLPPLLVQYANDKTDAASLVRHNPLMKYLKK